MLFIFFLIFVLNNFCFPLFKIRGKNPSTSVFSFHATLNFYTTIQMHFLLHKKSFSNFTKLDICNKTNENVQELTKQLFWFLSKSFLLQKHFTNARTSFKNVELLTIWLDTINFVKVSLCTQIEIQTNVLIPSRNSYTYWNMQ